MSELRTNRIVPRDGIPAGATAGGLIQVVQVVSKNKFYKHWHTHEDKLEHIDKNTLKAVGQTVMHVVYNEQMYKKSPCISGAFFNIISSIAIDSLVGYWFGFFVYM